MTKWEYMSLTRIIEYTVEGSLLSLSPIIKYHWDDEDQMGYIERLNALGEQGWELVSAYPQASERGSSDAGLTSFIRLIFKRPK